MKPSVCFVTCELHPFNGGGIGRLLRNLIDEHHRDVDMHVMLASAYPLPTTDGGGTLEGVTVHHAPMSRWHKLVGTAHEHRMSLEISHALVRLAKTVRFDFVEFHDFRGWGAAALETRDWQHGPIVVRLHGTTGIIRAHEARATPIDAFNVALERRALDSAHRLIAPLPSVIDAYQRFYGFPDAWRRRVEIAFPPVAPPSAECVQRPARERDLVFVTRVSRVKQPDLFVQAAARFMQRVPEFAGRAVLASTVEDAGLFAEVMSAIDRDLADRFVHVTDPQARAAAVTGSIAVIPSSFETLSLAAYEAAASGATLVVNQRCPAFADGTPFAAPEAAFRFDGTVDDLTRCLEMAWRSPRLPGPRWQADRPYWERPQHPA
ncbi:MAG: hypothetical protein EB084_04160 [Proteobacteria bacterium]|nr:hypothetical protein [Pseudomonadota bacterium]